MPGSLLTFVRKPRARVMAVLVGLALVALCVYGTFQIVGRASAARPVPRVGESISVFTSTYGNPAHIGTDRGLKVGNVRIEGVRFYADQGHTIIVNAQPVHGVVRSVVVTGPSSWSHQQSISYCRSFLPTGAVAYRTVGQYTYFHSSSGDMVLNDSGKGTCQVLIAPDVS